jgi:hypothetical protein
MLNGSKIDLVPIKYTNIFHCKALQNLPSLGFWSENKPSGNPVWNAERMRNSQEIQIPGDKLGEKNQ